MHDRELLARLLNPTALQPLITNGNKHSVILEENESKNATYQVSIDGLAADALVLKADNLVDLQRIFNSKGGVRRCADYIIINCDIIVFVELKYGKPDTTTHIKQQLKGAKCLIGYCALVGYEFYNHPNFLSGFTQRFVAITRFNLTRVRGSQPSPPRGNGKSPETMLIFSGRNHFRFKQFI